MECATESLKIHLKIAKQATERLFLRCVCSKFLSLNIAIFLSCVLDHRSAKLYDIRRGMIACWTSRCSRIRSDRLWMRHASQIVCVMKTGAVAKIETYNTVARSCPLRAPKNPMWFDVTTTVLPFFNSCHWFLVEVESRMRPLLRRNFTGSTHPEATVPVKTR